MTTNSQLGNERIPDTAEPNHPGKANTRRLQHLRHKLIRETETYLSNPASTAWRRANDGLLSAPAFSQLRLSAA